MSLTRGPDWICPRRHYRKFRWCLMRRARFEWLVFIELWFSSSYNQAQQSSGLNTRFGLQVASRPTWYLVTFPRYQLIYVIQVLKYRLWYQRSRVQRVTGLPEEATSARNGENRTIYSIFPWLCRIFAWIGLLQTLAELAMKFPSYLLAFQWGLIDVGRIKPVSRRAA